MLKCRHKYFALMMAALSIASVACRPRNSEIANRRSSSKVLGDDKAVLGMVSTDKAGKKNEVVNLSLHLESKTSPVAAFLINSVTGGEAISEIILVSNPTIERSPTKNIDIEQKGDESSLQLGSWRFWEPAPSRVVFADADRLGKLAASDINHNSINPIPKNSIVAEGTIVYRGMLIDKLTVDRVLAEGIDAPVIFNKRAGTISGYQSVTTQIKAHRFSSHRSIFVSTSHASDVALGFAKKKFGSGPDGVVFKIKVPANKGIDVEIARAGANSRIDPDNAEDLLYGGEQEVVIVGKVQPENILGYYDVRKSATGDKQLGDYHCFRDCD